MAVLLEALEITTDPPSCAASSRKSSIMNDVKNNGHNTMWCGSRSESYMGSSSQYT